MCKIDDKSNQALLWKAMPPLTLHGLVNIKEPALSNMYEIEALIEVLQGRGL